jgi:hypothetical protein
MGTACVIMTNKLCSKMYSKKLSQPESPLIDQKVIKEKEVVEIKFKSYKSSFDSIFSKVENNYNFFQYFQAYEYLFLLTNFNVENSAEDNKLFNPKVNTGIEIEPTNGVENIESVESTLYYKLIILNL